MIIKVLYLKGGIVNEGYNKRRMEQCTRGK